MLPVVIPKCPATTTGIRYRAGMAELLLACGPFRFRAHDVPLTITFLAAAGALLRVLAEVYVRSLIAAT